MYRQGDVLLMPVERLPRGAILLPERDALILARGEKTGHKHQLSGGLVYATTNGEGKSRRLAALTREISVDASGFEPSSGPAYR